MSFNILDAVRSQFSGDLVRRISSDAGEDPSATEKALPGAIAAIAGGVVEQGSNEAGAQRLISQLNDGWFTRADAPGMDDVAGSMGGLSHLATQGQGMMSGLFGNKMGGIADAVTKMGGLRNSGSSMKLLSLAAPVLMGVLGRQVRDKGLGASGLMQLLGGQRSLISSVLPAGLGGLLGMGQQARAPVTEVLHEREVVTTARPTTVREPVQREPVQRAPMTRAAEPKKSNAWVLPLVLLALVGLGWWMLRGRRHEPPPQAAVTQPAPRVDERVGTAPTPNTQTGVGGSGPATPARIQSASELRNAFTNGSVAQGVILDGVEFQTGSSQLTARGERAVADLGTILKEKPTTRIRVEGYTDSTGDASANRQLSQERADAVRASLMKSGINANRVEAAGLGAQDPVASNDTPAGRLQNRRIEIKTLGQ